MRAPSRSELQYTLPPGAFGSLGIPGTRRRAPPEAQPAHSRIITCCKEDTSSALLAAVPAPPLCCTSSAALRNTAVSGPPGDQPCQRGDLPPPCPCHGRAAFFFSLRVVRF